MKVSKNKKLDVAYVQFRKGTAARTVKIRPDLLMDLNQNNEILGIEFLKLSKTAPTLRKTKLPRRQKTKKKTA